MLTGISALTLATHNMARALAFYRGLGFVLKYGGPDARFSSLHAGSGYLNLMQMPAETTWNWWGRAIFYVDDVDAFTARAVAAGATVRMPVSDMFWGDRYGQLDDPFGHRWSIATRLKDLSPRELQKRASEFNAEYQTKNAQG